MLGRRLRWESRLALNNVGPNPAGEAAVGYLLAGINRAESAAGTALTFDELAAHSQGIDRLGVLRMDVDNLGSILAGGLTQDERSISRITNLSKALAYFFGGFVSALVEQPGEAWSGQAQIIYSGGDDVFIVGAWSSLPALARAIRREFGRFTGRNPVWGISGGLAVVRSKQPVAAAANSAAKLEDAAKDYQHFDGRPKDALAFLGDTLAWEDLDVVAALASELVSILDTGINAVPGFAQAKSVERKLPRGWVHRLIEIAGLYRRTRADLHEKDGAKRLADLEAATRRGRWVWNMAYALARATNNRELGARLEALMNALPGKSWDTPEGNLRAERDLIWLLQPAALWADYLSRERRS